LPYHDRLKQLNLHSLEYQRLCRTLIETQQIITRKRESGPVLYSVWNSSPSWT